MPHIDALLPLYPDTATRRTLFELSLVHARTDLAAIRQAIAIGDHTDARQQVHRAKGTVSFLRTDAQALQPLDALTEALRDQDLGRIAQAYPAVEACLLDLEAALLRQLEETHGA